MDKDRRAAYTALKNIEDKGTWSNLAASGALKQAHSENPAFVRELVYGCIRNRMLLDYNISRFLKKPKLSSSERVILRMGFYQLALMDGVKDYAAVSETVNLASSVMKGRSGFINAVLRSFQRDGKRLLYDSLSTKYSCAEWIAQLWEKAYGSEKAEEMLKTSSLPAPLTIRTNTLKNTRKDLMEKLSELGFSAVPTERSNLCLTVSGSGLLDIELYAKGFFSVQGEASCLAVEILDPKPGSKLLDLCAAPGGKSCAAAELMDEKGSVSSFDIYPHRVELIKKEAERLGLKTVNAAVMDGTGFAKELENTADFIIADVPCSGLGTIRRNPEIKLKEYAGDEALKHIEELSEIQYNILVNASRYLKVGGRLLYSTCTVNPKENGLQIKRFTSEHSGYNAVYEEQIFPSVGGPDGFYICVLSKES